MNSLAGGVNFQILSRWGGLENSPIGVDYSKLPEQLVRVNEPVNVWTPSRAGDNVYGFSVGDYRYTGISLEGDIIASTSPEADVKWYISYQQAEDAYTISPDNDHSVGWTVIIPDSNAHSTIELHPLGSSQDPEQQLFTFKVSSA